MKSIKTSLEIGTNYIFHLLSIARINYDNNYSHKYESTVSEKHREVLQKFKDRLSFANGNAGDLVEYMVFFPAYLGFNSQSDFERYFQLIKKAAQGRREEFFQEYGTKISERKWLPEIDNKWFEALHSMTEEIKILEEVYIENFTNYKDLVWPYEFLQMKEKSDELNEKLKKLDLIKSWEKITGSEFKAKEYEIVLVSAIEGGPNANSLGYNKNVFFSGAKTNWMLDFISHEVGTHIMADFALKLFKAPMIEPERMAEFYSAYECLSQFLNSLVLNRAPLYDLKCFRSEYYIPAYQELYNNGVRKPEDLLKAILNS
ncbi:hypothetical protein [Kosmotoga pacifica]|uniref:DUF4932 domain-containing protein n=1 Tax=Kosmotoga pacifica TaxID=1330330 RepID=A0A0G2ZET7_9BACT|nr:hypothetical protein [Kosmotoga pacifica]AKI97348.1 hypothetical protein IX53_05405 [Kosmotoga pacifica]